MTPMRAPSLLRQTGILVLKTFVLQISIQMIATLLIMLSKPRIRGIGPSMFEGEALGLNAMYETKSIRVPRPFKVWTLKYRGLVTA